MRLVADNGVEYRQLSRIQKLMVEAYKTEKENDPDGVMANMYKAFINTNIEKSYEKPGESTKVANTSDLQTDDPSMFIAYIVMSATQRKKLAIEYKDTKGGISKRLIEPHNWKNGQVVAWCHERGAWRQFKPAMIQFMALTDEEFDRTEEIEIKATDAKDMAHLVAK